MKIENNTKWSTEKITEIIEFAMPNNKHLRSEIERVFTIRIEEHNGGNNRNVMSPRRRMIILQTSTTRKYPWKEDNVLAKALDKLVRKITRPEDKDWVEEMFGPPLEKMTKDGDEYLDVEYLSREEELVFAAAHEFWHVRQLCYDHNMSNKRADMYAIKKQKEWRKLHNQPIYPKV